MKTIVFVSEKGGVGNFAVSRFCERASRLAGILVTEQQTTSKKLVAK